MQVKRADFLDSNRVVQAIETKDSIHGLFGKYRCLSNFHMYPITFQGLKYCCSEAAYMAQKVDDIATKQLFSNITVAAEAKKLGRMITLKDNWDDIHRHHAMYRVLFAKFAQDSESCSVLLSTGNKYLEESNWWRDDYWGKCTEFGLNNLGQTLMTIRDFILGQ